MSLTQILCIMKARYKIALSIFLISLAVGAAAIKLLPSRYASTSSVVFDVKQRDPIFGSNIMPLGYLATQVEIINSDRVAKRVVKALRFDESPAVKAQWLEATGGRGKLEDWAVSLVKRGLQVTPSLQSNVISISYIAGDPTFAAAVANAYAQAYIDASIELRVDPARQTNIWFGEQSKAARENLENAQARLSAFQKSKGLIARNDQVDVETTKLNDLMNQLNNIQAQMVDTASKQRSVDMATLPDVMQNSVVASLRSQIAQKEVALQDAAVTFGKNHPNYQRLDNEIDALKKQLVVETRNVATSFGTLGAASRDREAGIRAAIDAQRKRLLSIKGHRDELAVLERDLAVAQSAYDQVIRRYNETGLESQITQTNVSVLNPAIAGLEPTSPNINKIGMLAIFLGLLLGGSAAFLLELIDRRVRSVEDLAEMLQVPVLAVIQPPSRRLLSFERQKLLGAPQ